MHLRGLERFDLDSVLFPYNHSLMANEAYRADVEALLDVCAERNVAGADDQVDRQGSLDQPGRAHYSWYEPLTDSRRDRPCVRYVLTNDRLFLNTSSDARLLPQLVDAASGDLTSPSDEELRADEERFDITPLFDGRELERI
jgi:hypothetical protein